MPHRLRQLGDIGVNRGAVAVELSNGSVIRGIIAGRLTQHRIKVMVGDKVSVEVALRRNKGADHLAL